MLSKFRFLKTSWNLKLAKMTLKCPQGEADCKTHNTNNVETMSHFYFESFEAEFRTYFLCSHKFSEKMKISKN